MARRPRPYRAARCGSMSKRKVIPPVARSIASNFPVCSRRGLTSLRQVDERVVAKKVGALRLEDFQHRDGDLSDLNVRRGVATHLDEVPQGTRISGHENAGLR